MRKFLVAGNWKMNGDTARNRALIEGIISGAGASGSVDILVCPPYPFLGSVAEMVTGTELALGAQNVSEHASGAYTGEVSADMLIDVGCRYVIVGHSERRALYGETSAQVAEKFQAALTAGLTPILCIGETLEQRKAGATETVVAEQLQAVVDRCGVTALGAAVLAYEPVWAIGTGEVATPEQAQAVHRHLRELIAADDETIAAGVRILYGGSMKGDNAAGLLEMADIDGGLIGGASLKAPDFLAIVEAAANI